MKLLFPYVELIEPEVTFESSKWPGFTPAQIRYHGLDHDAPTDRLPAEERSEERGSSSLHQTPSAQESPRLKFFYSRVKEKPGENAGSRKKPRPVNNGWRPVTLRRTSIAAFVLLFCLLLAALEIMNQYSIRHQSLVTTIHRADIIYGHMDPLQVS